MRSIIIKDKKAEITSGKIAAIVIGVVVLVLVALFLVKLGLNKWVAQLPWNDKNTPPGEVTDDKIGVSACGGVPGDFIGEFKAKNGKYFIYMGGEYSLLAIDKLSDSVIEYIAPHSINDPDVANIGTDSKITVISTKLSKYPEIAPSLNKINDGYVLAQRYICKKLQ